MDKQQILYEIKKTILNQAPNADVNLYGSYSRGDNQVDSDIDILILVDKEPLSWKDEKKITYPLYDLEFKTNYVISPLIRSKKTWYEKYPNTGLFININKEGIKI
jgi:predicted nucleotidyltransferase